MKTDDKKEKCLKCGGTGQECIVWGMFGSVDFIYQNCSGCELGKALDWKQNQAQNQYNQAVLAEYSTALSLPSRDKPSDTQDEHSRGYTDGLKDSYYYWKTNGKLPEPSRGKPVDNFVGVGGFDISGWSAVGKAFDPSTYETSSPSDTAVETVITVQCQYCHNKIEGDLVYYMMAWNRLNPINGLKGCKKCCELLEQTIWLRETRVNTLRHWLEYWRCELAFWLHKGDIDTVKAVMDSHGCEMCKRRINLKWKGAKNENRCR